MIDLTTGVNLSSQDIIKVLAAEAPTFNNTRADNVEFASGFPNMMYTLWGFICTYRKFPTQSDFVAYYHLVHQDTLQKYDKTAVTARLLRSYPSLAREIHFYQLVKESQVFDSVSYCAFDDVENGIDINVILGGHEYNISCFVETKRSLWFRKRKTYRHKTILNSIEMPLNLSKGKQIGEWIVFDETHVDELLNKVINYAWFHYQQHPLELLSS